MTLGPPHQTSKKWVPSATARYLWPNSKRRFAKSAKDSMQFGLKAAANDAEKSWAPRNQPAEGALLYRAASEVNWPRGRQAKRAA